MRIRICLLAALLLGACETDCDPTDPSQPFSGLVVAPPTLTCGPAPGIGLPGQALLRLQFTIEGGLRGQPYDIRADFGDGTPPETLEGVEAFETRTLEHAYARPGVYSVSLSGRNRTTGQQAAPCSTSYEVRGPSEAPPTRVLGLDCRRSPSGGPAPLLVDFTMRVRDCPGPCEAIWDFGDGTPPVRGRDVSHRYEQPGRYVAQGSVRDGTGQSTACPSRPVDVEPAAPPSPYTPPTPYSPPPPSPY